MTMPTSIRRRWFVATVTSLAIALTLWFAYTRWLRTASALPEGEIASARLQLIDGGSGELLETSPTLSDIEGILAALNPYRMDQEPAKWAVIGGLDVNWTSGERRSIGLFCSGDDEAAFEIGGTYYHGGSDQQLIAALRLANPMWKFPPTGSKRPHK